jgi:hypothetical protein
MRRKEGKENKENKELNSANCEQIGQNPQPGRDRKSGDDKGQRSDFSKGSEK